MSVQTETIISPVHSSEANFFSKKTYVMRGLRSELALETYHLILAPSFKCNISCRHCYLPDHNAHTLSKECVLRLVDEWSEIVVAERGAFGGIFHLKGGEPLILPYLNDVLDRLEEMKSLRFMMTTNGIVRDWDVVERIDRLNVALDGNVQVIVSLDGSNEAVNAQLRGAGNFEKTVDFICQLNKEGITIFLNNVIHQGNIDDIESFTNLALELGVTQVNFLSFVPKGYGKEMRFGRPNPVEVFEHIHAIWENGDECIRSLLAGSLSDILHAESCGTCTSSECVGGYRGLLYIVTDGTAYSCPNLNHPGLEAGNVSNFPLKKIHDALLSKVYPEVRTLEGEAEDRYLCKGERYLPNAREYFDGNFTRLQPHLGNSICNKGMSYCFNRNW